MTEVLAGLRYRFGSPVGTNVDIEDGSLSNNGYGTQGKI